MTGYILITIIQVAFHNLQTATRLCRLVLQLQPYKYFLLFDQI